MSLPSSLEAFDAWLAAREQSAPKLRPPSAARFHWVPGPRRKTPLSVVYLHGFSADPAETSPFSERLGDALGANVFIPRLTGHGQDGAAMGAATMEAWLADLALAMDVGRALGERVVLAGCSTGGTLATWEALQAGTDPSLAALLLLSPNFGPRDPRSGLLYWPGARTWAPWLVGKERSIDPENDAHGRHWTTTYPIAALFPMMALVRETLRSNLGQIHTPTWVAYHPDDDVVSVPKMKSALGRFGVTPVWHECPAEQASKHVIAGDAFAPEATNAVLSSALTFLAAQGFGMPEA
jgi:esterase/lipase